MCLKTGHPSSVCVCDCGGGWLVVCCLGQHLFTHSWTVWDAKESRWMNQCRCLLLVSWLQVCGHERDILQSIKTLRCRHTLTDRTQEHYSFFFFGGVFLCFVADLFFPSIQANETGSMFITLCEPSLTACLVSFLTWNKAAIIALKLQMLLCIVWNKTGEKKIQEKRCTAHCLSDFWVIRLFMCAGTPRQWNNDMSLQVVCRIFLGFWRGLRGKVSKGVPLVCVPFRGLC